MNVGIIGTGTVGSATGVALAAQGHTVLFQDIDRSAVDNVPEMWQHLFTVDVRMVVRQSDFLFICVPTPSDPTNGRALLGTYEQAVDGIIDALISLIERGEVGGKLTPVIVQRSTCPPGTAREIRAYANGRLSAHDVRINYVVMPEFLNSGRPVEDALAMPVPVCGTFEDESWDHDRLQALFHWRDLVFMTPEEAELTKYAANCLNATMISFWNEIFLVGQALERDGAQAFRTHTIARVLAEMPELQTPYRVHGKAYGGECLPKDTKALLYRMFSEIGVDTPILRGVVETNGTMRRRFGEREEHWDELHD